MFRAFGARAFASSATLRTYGSSGARNVFSARESCFAEKFDRNIIFRLDSDFVKSFEKQNAAFGFNGLVFCLDLGLVFQPILLSRGNLSTKGAIPDRKKTAQMKIGISLFALRL